ncbi:hypothetical protein DY000_02008460 [Brassica cretica]|uniref:Dof-type domain-containing protein n=1 Tax=Brassica cretica TaxID=69181 RepID=A0ABQ7C946_BRACR|nr:hypothetical protein DY000_02008460 [Brassica cretica]
MKRHKYGKCTNTRNKKLGFPLLSKAKPPLFLPPAAAASLSLDASSEEKTEVTFPAVPVKEEVVVREVIEKRRFAFMDLICFGLMGLIITLLLGYIGDITEEDPFLTPT